jgi:uncharacterized protein (TIGR03435 family)
MKEVKFEVISIRLVDPKWSPYGSSPGPLNNPNPTPDGYSSRLTVETMIMIAYGGDPATWSDTPLLKMPPWPNDWYDMKAPVSDDDREAWRKQGSQHELLRSSMRDALKERFKLVIHELPTEAPGYKLVVGKKGPKLTLTPPGFTLPEGNKLQSGGVLVSVGRTVCATTGQRWKIWHGPCP